MNTDTTPETYRDAYEAWKAEGQRLHAALLLIWRALTPGSEYGDFGSDPQAVVDTVMAYLNRAEPAEEQIARVIDPSAWASNLGPSRTGSIDRARAVLALLAAQPTVREAKAQGWERGYQAGSGDARANDAGLDDDYTPNPYRSEADHG